jgi:heme/copper-type cytochrome/quinol oxidase subunit 2
MELLFAVFPAFLAIFVHVFAVVFFCMQQRWFQFVHGDAQQQKEKSVILLLFWAARPAAWFGF